jgi:predicted site-specific integrase-resolvase
MKLTTWARKNGVSIRTAYRWFHAGQLPSPSRQLPSGTILVDEATETTQGAVVIYARVSSHDQKADLERQVSRLATWATKNKMAVGKIVTEVGSGMNGKRTKLLMLLRNPHISVIIAEHQERLARFGYEMMEACMNAAGRKFIVVETRELQDDLVQDMIDVLTSFCARLYGKRSAKNRAKRALEACK